jgi:Zn-finger nucleic acid-binding protein
MMTCNKCEYIIDGSLKFAVVNNVCPKCGSAILDDNELAAIGQVNNDMKDYGFSSDVEKYTLYTISLFIYNNYIKNRSVSAVGSGQEQVLALEDHEADSLSEHAGNSDDKISDDEHAEPAPSPEDDTIFSEEEYAYEKDSLSGLEDEDKVARLKRLARESKLGGKTGAMVRRTES